MLGVDSTISKKRPVAALTRRWQTVWSPICATPICGNSEGIDNRQRIFIRRRGNPERSKNIPRDVTGSATKIGCMRQTWIGISASVYCNSIVLYLLFVRLDLPCRSGDHPELGRKKEMLMRVQERREQGIHRDTERRVRKMLTDANYMCSMYVLASVFGFPCVLLCSDVLAPVSSPAVSCGFRLFFDDRPDAQSDIKSTTPWHMIE